MKNCIIGLTGFDGAGKTTVANYLRDEHGFTVVSFADELKRLLMILNPIVGVDEDWNDEGDTISYPVHLKDFVDEAGQFHEYELKTLYPEYRRLLRVFGTEVIRENIDPDYWAAVMYSRVLNTLDDASAEGKLAQLVIPDVRFLNEVDVVHNLASVGETACSVAFVKSATPEEVDANVHESNLYAGNLGEDREIDRDWGYNELSPFELVQVEDMLLELGVTDA